MNRFVEFLVGLLFGVGLLLSGMADPGKVIGFLDLAGAWDPSLALVMGGAVAVGVFAFAVARKRTTSFLGSAMQLPAGNDVDARLIVGSVVFGVGWGLAGFCPGPALVAAGAGHPQAWVFTLAMIAGMALHEMSSRLAPDAGLIQE
ncbi:MAG: YeeE/YedE family protein [Ramlibacter sp.]